MYVYIYINIKIFTIQISVSALAQKIENLSTVVDLPDMGTLVKFRYQPTLG